MPSGHHHHLKRLAAPKSWSLAKTGGTFATRMRSGSHNKEISIPVNYVVAKLLNVAKTAREIAYILHSKNILVNGRVVTDRKAPVGLFDVVTVAKTHTNYRMLLNAHGRFRLIPISEESARLRITKVRAKDVVERVAYTRTLDGHNFRYVDPAVSVADTVVVDIAENKVVDYMRFEAGRTAFVFGGSNSGRVGVIQRIDVRIDKKSFLHLVDANQKPFRVPAEKAIVIGDGARLLVELSPDAGLRMDEHERSNARYAPAEGVAVN